VTVVFDTTVLIDLLRGDANALAYARGLSSEQILCSELSRLELIQGLRSHERSGAEALMNVVAWAAPTTTICRRAGQLGRLYLRTHVGVTVTDLVIAATALENEAELATTNGKHFPMFPDLIQPY